MVKLLKAFKEKRKLKKSVDTDETTPYDLILTDLKIAKYFVILIIIIMITDAASSILKLLGYM